MGLDMYLTLERKVQYYDTTKTAFGVPEEISTMTALRSKKEQIPVLNSTSYTIGYWRKSYAIHNFFVTHCALEVDEITLSGVEVDYSILEKLRDVCEEVLKDHSKAGDLLPDDMGTYDASYFSQIEYTKKLVTNLLEYLKKCYEIDKEYNKEISSTNAFYYTTVTYSASW